jgi:hypothetical protein
MRFPSLTSFKSALTPHAKSLNRWFDTQKEMLFPASQRASLMTTNAITEQLVLAMHEENSKLLSYWAKVALNKMALSGWPIEGDHKDPRLDNYMFRYHLKGLIFERGTPFALQFFISSKIIRFDSATNCLSFILRHKTERAWLSSAFFRDLCIQDPDGANGLPWSEYMEPTFSDAPLTPSSKLAAAVCRAAIEQIEDKPKAVISYETIQEMKNARFFTSFDLRDALMGIQKRFKALNSTPQSYFVVHHVDHALLRKLLSTFQSECESNDLKAQVGLLAPPHVFQESGPKPKRSAL